MNKSASVTKLAEALAKAQAKMPVVKMNAQNPFLKNKYADLGAVIETSRPILAENGLSISQFPTSDGDRIGVTTILMHTSGEWLEDTISISLSDSKGLSVAQSAGVAISYLRRYSWASTLGLYADEDTDGHSGNGKEKSDIISAEKWEQWTKLVNRANAVKVKVPQVNRTNITIEKLREIYGELKTNVENAEAQAKAGE